ncbi:MAG: type II secretion system protein [Campylobacter sp.]|nr:type II secretion system protein [Campylobacter sp.]
MLKKFKFVINFASKFDSKNAFSSTKRGFALLSAIVFAVTIAFFALLILNFSASSQKQVSDTYLSEQAELIARGATEYAMLRILKHDFSETCLNKLEGSFTPPQNGAKKLFDIKITLKYFGKIGVCTKNDYVEISDNSQGGSVLIDVFVRYAGDDTNDVQAHPINFHRRTLQKI